MRHDCLTCDIKNYYPLMQILTKQQLLEKELSILGSVGPSLSSFYSHDSDHPLLFEPTPSARQIVEQDYKLTNIRTALPGCNSIFHVLAYVILSECLSQQNGAHDLLNKLRCILYSDQFVLSNFTGFPHPELTSKNMKKLFVQFLQVASYHKKNLAFILAKYQIVPDIFTAIFRNLLQEFHVKDAKCFYRELNDLESASALLDFFDISYVIRNNIIAFENKSICIAVDPALKEVFIGERCNDVSTKTSDFQLQLNLNDQVEAEAPKKQFGFLTPTPCFLDISSWEDAINPTTVKTAIGNPMPVIEQYNHQLQQSGERRLQSSPTEQDKFYQKYSSSSKSKQQLAESSKNAVAEDTRIFKHFLTKDEASETPKSLKQADSGFRKQKINKMKHSELIYNRKEEREGKMLERKQTLSQKLIKNDDRSDNEERATCIELGRCKVNKLQSNVMEVVIEPAKTQKRYKTSIFQQIKYEKKEKGKEIKGTNFNTSLRVGAKNYNKIPAFLNHKIQSRHVEVVRPPTIGVLPVSNNPFNPNQSFNARNAQQRVTFTYTSRELSPLYTISHNTTLNNAASKATNNHVNQSHKLNYNLNTSMQNNKMGLNDTSRLTTRTQNNSRRPKTEISETDSKNTTQKVSPFKPVLHGGHAQNNNPFFRYFGN